MPFVTRKSVAGLLAVALIAIGMVAGFIWSGLYNIGADDHHARIVSATLQELRENSIRVRSANLQVPDLEDGQRVLAGAGHYAAMCSGCHLAPGMRNSELREGLYPLPPELAKERIDPKRAFWIIKHGIKMSGMPAWGQTHDDPTIWSMVAFLHKLPDLTPAQYKAIVARAPPDEDMDMDMDMGNAASPAAPGNEHGHHP